MNLDIIGLTFETEIVSVLGVTETNFIGFVSRNKARGYLLTDLKCKGNDLIYLYFYRGKHKIKHKTT